MHPRHIRIVIQVEDGVVVSVRTDTDLPDTISVFVADWDEGDPDDKLLDLMGECEHELL